MHATKDTLPVPTHEGMIIVCAEIEHVGAELLKAMPVLVLMLVCQAEWIDKSWQWQTMAEAEALCSIGAVCRRRKSVCKAISLLELRPGTLL